MARIYVAGEWYEQIAPTSMYEDNYEALVLQHASALYPEYLAVQFKPVVTSETGSAKPDLALIERQYRSWWVVEVEMGYHSFTGHVLPQVTTLAEARYGEPEVGYLCHQSTDLERQSVADMLKGSQPRVLVIVNEPKPDWSRDLAPLGVAVAVFEVFRSDRNQYLFRVNGDQPAQMNDVLSRCWLEPSLLRLLSVESPGALQLSRNTRVRIWYQSQLTEWERIDARDKVWLSPVSKNPLQPNISYELVRRGDGTLDIRPQQKRKGAAQ